MKQINWKAIIPHAIAISIFLIVALVYCKPALEGRVLQQNDITQWKSMAQNQQMVYEATGKIPLWTNGMFSGMPGYMIKGWSNNYIPFYFIDIISLHLPKPFQFFFLASICFYFLSQVLRANNWVGTVIALCYAYATYNVVIVAEGHDTKMLSLALLPGFIGALLLIFHKKYWWGLALTTLFMSALIAQKHYQITYYSVLIVAFMSLGFAINWIREKQYKHLFIAALLSLAGTTTGTLINAVVILPDNEYTKESIRGGSVLADDKSKNTKEGLTKEYAFSYSIFKSEPFVMLIPRMFGGSNKMEVEPEKSKAVEALQEMNQQIAQQLQGALGFYWGGIGGTSGPPYVGAIIVFLAIMGFIILDAKYKWWIAACMLLTIMMSWGSYFEGFNNFLFNYLPLYNKFRAPSMILVVPTFLLNLMALLTLDKIISTTKKEWLFKKYKQGLIATAAVFLLLFILYISFDYKGEGDTQLMKSINSIPDETTKQAFLEAGKKMVNGLIEDRKSLFLGDILRSLFFIAVAAAGLWALIKNKLKPTAVVALIGVFALIDIFMIDGKYLNAENYQYKEDYDNTFTPTEADKFILQDTGYYRVFDVSNGAQAAINYGARPAYWHKSVGGYHPAKLSIYQDLAEKQLYNYPNCMPVLNMLNTKYIIHGTSSAQQVEPNPNACGAVWFVKGLLKVNTPKEEIEALTNLNVKDTAVIQSTKATSLQPFAYDSTASIKLVKNENDVITYTSKSNTTQFAVFSEIYYNKGWNAYIDGKVASYVKVNYVLRGMIVPAGEHQIVFKFEPKSHAVGWQLTNIASIVAILLLGLAIFFQLKKRK